MKRFLGIISIFLVLSLPVLVRAASDPNDYPGGKDPPLFNRMPGFFISHYEEVEFDRYEFQLSSSKTQAVEGHHIFVYYNANQGVKYPSGLQITRNYANAIKAIGGQQVYNFEDGGTYYVILKVVKNNTETWACVGAVAHGEFYTVRVVQKQAMDQDVAADAKSMSQDIKNTGKVAIYGIYFDTGKSVIKPESDPALKEIAKMLQADAKLKLYVVGHTDNQGGFDYNMKLSKARADAVVKALTTKYPINASRLQSCGVGPVAPSASNLTEEGRAKNRRVELVAQ